MSRYPDTLPSSSVAEQQLRQIQEKKAKAKAILKMKKRQRTRLPPGPLCHALEAKPEPKNCHEVNDEEAAFLQDMESAQHAEEDAFLQDLEEEAAFLQDLEMSSPEDHPSSKFKIQVPRDQYHQKTVLPHSMLAPTGVRPVATSSL